MSSTIVLPGQSLGTSSQHTSSTGTHLFNDQVCASLAGHSYTHPPGKSSNHPQPLISVLRTTNSAQATSSALNTPLLPTVGATILGRVIRTTPRQAIVSILCVANTSISSLSTSDQHQGIIRALDVRATQVDTVKIAESFRPGDIVRATVISLGDQSNYYLSTAGNELGVIMARSSEGNDMVPSSWKDMRDPVTGKTEARKVAKPV
jgi:exosome complex component CSL4